jgi:hypothetical protein
MLFERQYLAGKTFRVGEVVGDEPPEWLGVA